MDKKRIRRKEENAEPLPFPETDLSPALQRAIKAKIERGELDEADLETFEKNLRKAVKKGD